MRMPKREKAATNLSVRVDLVRRARELELNLSEVLERALERAIDEAERDAWLAENDVAIAAYNERVAEQGVFSDRWRKF
jgi:antitoxin CcdA